jgi:hypothetical protein
LLAVPEPTEWQGIGDQIDAGMIFARANFTNTGICHETVMNPRLAVEMTPPARRSKGMVQAAVVVGQDITGACEFKDLVAWSG